MNFVSCEPSLCFARIFRESMFLKTMAKKLDLGLVFRGQIDGKSLKKIAFQINAFWDVVFKVILNGFGRGLGRVWEAMLATFLDVFATFWGFFTIW